MMRMHCSVIEYTSCQSRSLLWDRSSSMTWAQKAAISACSPALLIPQPLNTSIVGTFRRSVEDVEEDGRKNQTKMNFWCKKYNNRITNPPFIGEPWGPATGTTTTPMPGPLRYGKLSGLYFSLITSTNVRTLMSSMAPFCCAASLTADKKNWFAKYTMFVYNS